MTDMLEMLPDNRTLRQTYREDYMILVARSPECPILPEEQTTQADRWWPGTVPTKWETLPPEEIKRLRKGSSGS